MAVRPYDKNFAEFKKIYDKDSTASVRRLFVNKSYRRCGLASLLYKTVEEFCHENNFK